MSKVTVAKLFADKVAKVSKASNSESPIGKEIGPIEFDSSKDRHYQRFVHGVILGRKNDLAKDSDLICVYGRLFDAWWEKPDAAWLGEPLDDLYETTSAEGFGLMVQRFEKGVIWCRSDGADGIHWLSWRDWHAISRPGNNKDTPPS